MSSARLVVLLMLSNTVSLANVVDNIHPVKDGSLVVRKNIALNRPRKYRLLIVGQEEKA